jgi:hypothetical protein
LEGESPEAELTRDYLRWCERTGRPGDCLRLLTESPTVNGDGRFALALALAKGAVLDEMLEAFKDMADPHAMVAAVLWTWTTYMILVSSPDVTISKGLAAMMTATIISYVGVDTFWGLVVGFKRLMGEADRATTFNELREAGERYGKVMGRNAARAFVLLAMAAIGNTVPGLASQVPKLPGAMQAVAQAESQVGIRLVAVGEVETVAVSAGTVTIALAPGAVAMTARGGRDNDKGTGRTNHGQQRADEARGGDTHRQVGDANRVIQEGRKFTDSETGNIVHVSGDRVVITSKAGQIVSQFRNPRANTQSRIQSGRWVPRDE